MPTWQAWLQKGDFTDWVQATASIAALFVAFVSLRVSRRAIDVGVTAVILPVEIRWNDDTPQILLQNVGEHGAYDIVVISSTFINLTQVKKIKASGQQVLKADEKALYDLGGTSIFAFNQHYPIVIKYALASGTVKKSYWIYLMGQSKSVKFIRLNWYQSLLKKASMRLSVFKFKNGKHK